MQLDSTSCHSLVGKWLRNRQCLFCTWTAVDWLNFKPWLQVNKIHIRRIRFSRHGYSYASIWCLFWLVVSKWSLERGLDIRGSLKMRFLQVCVSSSCWINFGCSILLLDTPIKWQTSQYLYGIFYWQCVFFKHRGFLAIWSCRHYLFETETLRWFKLLNSAIFIQNRGRSLALWKWRRIKLIVAVYYLITFIVLFIIKWK